MTAPHLNKLLGLLSRGEADTGYEVLANYSGQRLKLGIDAGETSVSKYTVRRRKASTIGTNGARPETYAPGYRTERATG